MTASSRNDNGSKSPAHKDVYPADRRSIGLDRPRRWATMVRDLRNRNGLTQAVLAERLGVTQASVSRWESGRDLPSLRLRRTMRDMMRSSLTSDVARQLRARLRYTPYPMSLVGLGPRFLDFSQSFCAETTVDAMRLNGRSIYGHYGEEVDATTQSWESCGILKGDIAMTLTVLRLKDDEGKPVFLKNFDTPHRLESDDFVTTCETRRISKTDYDQHLATYGCPVFFLSYDDIAD